MPHQLEYAPCPSTCVAAFTHMLTTTTPWPCLLINTYIKAPLPVRISWCHAPPSFFLLGSGDFNLYLPGCADYAPPWLYQATLVSKPCPLSLGSLGDVIWNTIPWIKMEANSTFLNELISRDEGMHTDFACLLFSHLKYRPHPDVIKMKFLYKVGLGG